MRHKLMILIAIFAMAASACGSSATVATAAVDDEATENAESIASSDTDTADVDAAADEDVTSDEPLEYESPLFDMLGFDPSSFEDIDWEQAERDRQLLVQECMVNQGFEYTPVDFGSVMFFDGGNELDEEWGTLAFAEKYGLGISTLFEQELGSAADFQDVEVPNDPNDAYLEFLSDSEREAWQAALYGSQPELFDFVDQETGEPINPETNEPYTNEEMDAFWQNYEPTGCENAGFDGGFGSEETKLIDSFFDEFTDVFEGMEEQLENDPRIVELTDNWVRCMADKSYSFTAPEDVWREVERRMEPIRSAVWGGDMFGPAAFDMTPEDMEAMTEEELDEFFSDFQPPAPEITSETQAMLDAVIAYEIPLAVADFGCQQGSERVYMEVQKEIELRFIEENQGEITAFLEKNQG